jgi:uncharacterized protein (TIGR03437 family)
VRAFYATALASVVSCCAFSQTYTIQTFAGGGLPVGIPGISASLSLPAYVALDAAGNLFFTDPTENIVLRFDAKTGLLTLVAGNGTPGFSGDVGPATSAQLNFPRGVAVDSAGNVYIADTYNNRIRKVSNGVISTVAGIGPSNSDTGGYSGDNGPAASAQLNDPTGVAVDSAGSLYIADWANNRIRKVSNDGVITTVAGNGTQGNGGDGGLATSAQLFYPSDVALDASGNLYIADTSNACIRKVSNGVITTVAGGGGVLGVLGDNGPATSATFNGPEGVAVDAAGNLYIADAEGNRVRMVSNGVITTVAGVGPVGNGNSGYSGDGGPAATAQVSVPTGVAVDSAGILYIADSYNNRIRAVVNGVIRTVAGSGPAGYTYGGYSGDNGPAASAQLTYPRGAAVDSAGNVYFADSNNNRIRRVSNGVITTVAGNGTAGFSGDNGPATSAELNAPYGVALDSAGNLYIADHANYRVRKVSNGVITTVAGNGTTYGGYGGPATSAGLNEPTGVAVDSAGNLYIANEGSVYKVSNGVITVVAGNLDYSCVGANGPSTSVPLCDVQSIAVDAAGNVYIAEGYFPAMSLTYGENRVVMLSNGVLTTVAGSGAVGFSGDNGPGAKAELDNPSGVAVDSVGNLYITDSSNNRVRKISNGVITTISGNGTPGYSGDGGPATSAELNASYGLAVDSAGTVYFADSANGRVRVLTPSAPLGTPQINAGGVVNLASYTAPVAPGSIAAVLGTFFVNSTPDTDLPLDTSLQNLSFQFGGGAKAPLFFVSSGQVNLQAPWELAGQSKVTLAATLSGQTGASQPVNVAPFAPAIFAINGQGSGQGAILDPSYYLVDSSNPATAGTTIVLIFCTGLGAVTNQPATGSPAPDSPLAWTTTLPTVTIGGAPATVFFSGLAPDFVGLYQVNALVPAGLAASGAAPVVISMGGVSSNTVTIAVH